MLLIPLTAVPSQKLTVQLGEQACQISIYQKIDWVYCDLYVNNVLIVGGVLCRNVTRIVRSLYLGFVGDLVFIDSEGDADPEYTGLGGRFNLIYLEAADLPTGVG